MEIEITTRDRQAEFDLFAATDVDRQVTRVELNGGVVVRYEGTIVRKGLDFPNIISVTAVYGGGIATSLVASAIWDWLKARLKKPPERIEIDRVEVEFEEGAIKRLISERVTRRD